MEVFSYPNVLNLAAAEPTAVLSIPPELYCRAAEPTAVLSLSRTDVVSAT